VRDLATCLRRVHPETRPEDIRAVPQNEAEQEAFAAFQALLLEAWKELLGGEPAAEQVVRLLSLFRIDVLDVDPGETGEQDAEGFLRQAVLAGSSNSGQCWATLTQIMGNASESRIVVTREGLRRELQHAGFALSSTLSYRPDIDILRRHTELTLQSLKHLAKLVVHGLDVRIERSVTQYLRQEAEKRSLVVIGDPGAGKSGVLHELATALDREMQDVVFLAADRLDESLKVELGLEHDLAEVLENWSGTKPGLLLIDALDAARGSSTLQVLNDLIRRVATTPDSRWRVVASIRIFDLRYSQELQQTFRRELGEDGPKQYQDDTLFVRHIRVPRFSPEELSEVRAKAPELDAVFRTATAPLLELLDIPFNLRLVTEMLSEEGERTDFRGIETQVGLLRKYWENRVIKSATEGDAREAVLTEVVQAVVRERRLTVAKGRLPIAARTKDFSSLCSDNVLVEQAANLHGRYVVGFSHHLLFDYAGSRLLLVSDFNDFLRSLGAERDLTLFLRPSIDLFFKEAWLKGRNEFWSYLRLFSAHETVPAIAKIIGPAVIPELAKAREDLAPLVEGLSSLETKLAEMAEQWIAHAVGAVLAGVPMTSLELWSNFSLELAEASHSVRIAALCQSLIDHILEQMKWGAQNTLSGRLALSGAAVRLLEALTATPRREGWMVARSISNVMDLFNINPKESALVLRKLIAADEVRNHGAEQGHWIARKLPLLFDNDPQLAADIFAAFLGYNELSEEQTSLGGSRILAMTSNRRQDYHQAHWQLAQSFPRFVEEHFEVCAPIIVAAIENFIESEHAPRTPSDVITYDLDGKQHAALADYSAIWDSSGVRNEVQNIADAYFRKLETLAKTPSTVQLAVTTVSWFLERAKYAYFLRKVLIAAAKAGPALARGVYPLLASDSVLCSYDLSSLIGDTLRTSFAGLDEEGRRTVEFTILNLPRRETGERLQAMERVRDRLLGCIPTDQLVLPESIERAMTMTADGGPPDNRPPYVSLGARYIEYSEADRFRERGVPIDTEPNATLRAAAGRLGEFAGKFTNGIPKASDVAAIEADIAFVRAALLEKRGEIHEEVMNSAEAQLLAACAAAAKVDLLDCSTPLGKQLRTTLFAGMESKEPAYHPESDAQWDRVTGWGAPIQRIEAAAGIGNLLAHRSCYDEVLLGNVQRALVDPVPAVRFQVATRLLPMYDKDIVSLWSILERFVREEPRVGVLSGALYAVINPLAGRYKIKVIELIRALLGRDDLADDGGEAFEWGYRIATGLYLWQDDAAAFALVKSCVSGGGFRPRRATHCLSDIREALTFASDVPKETDAGVRRRAFGLVETILGSIKGRMDHLISKVPVEARDKRWQEKFQELARLVDSIGSEIFFSSGAFDGTNSHEKLDGERRQTFWHESQCAIRLLSDVAIPSVAHHLLETLQTFVPFDPGGVFHAIAAVVRSAKSWGYQYESLAVDLLVKITEVYLAEHRSLLQNDPQSRSELVDILETFVDAGWPSARRLSYRLEEIFR
jgi:hypothetical protein